MSIKQLSYLFSLSVIVAGCAANMNVNDKVIAVVGNRQITYGEFQRQYAQNALPTNDTSNTIAKKEKFLDLLVNYDLKLLDARKANLRNDPAISSEMKSYEGQLAVAYILEHEITESMVQKIYDRRKDEVRAQQVFIQIRPDSTYPHGDTLKAYDEALNVIKDLKAGAPVDSLAHIYKGGDTYYITAGNYLQYVGGEEFENMLYSLKPGEVGSVPIRTAYGYLVLKLTDRRPRYESIRASHILIRTVGNTPADTLKAYEKAMAVLDSAKAGVDFAKLAMDNSADTVSAKRGGDLGYFSRGMMVRPFDEAAFNLKVGELAGPVRTQFGYHIIKVTDIKQVPPFDQEKNRLRSTYLNGGYKLDLEKFEDQLKSRYTYKVNDKLADAICAKFDPSKPFSETDFDSLLSGTEMNATLFTFDNDSATVDTVISELKSSETLSRLPATSENFVKAVNEAGNEMVLTHYALAKAPTYPEFDSLIKKYEDGILIYQIEQNRVWSRIVATDSVLKPYFQKDPAKFMWPRRVDLSMIKVGSMALADSLHGLLVRGADFDTLASRFCTGKDLREKAGHWGLFADSTNSLVIVAFGMKVGEFSGPVRFNGEFSIIKVNGFVPPQPKTFEEARAEVSSDYQEYESKKLQNEWLEGLRKEFGVKIDEKTFHELVAKE